MMPSVLRQSGPRYLRDGKMFTPRALISTCEVCGEPAPYGDKSSGKLLTWCRNHDPTLQTYDALLQAGHER